MDLALSARAYWCPKSSGTRSDWEDGFALSEPHGVVAVADGATWSPRSRQWARALATSFLAAHESRTAVTASNLPDLVGRVAAQFEDQLTNQGDDGMAWWSDEVKARGAAAAFVGLHVDLRAGLWHAVAVGDCCLFHFPVEGKPSSFPLTVPDQFTSSPALISSNEPVDPGDIAGCDGTCSAGDVFVLASDAFSSWMVAELGSATLPQLLDAVRSSNFGSLVDQLRSSGRIPDDDVTFVRARVIEGVPR